MSKSVVTGCFCGLETFGFVIECDKCYVEHHGSCIKITEAVAKHIFKYLCAKCANKQDGTDEIVYGLFDELDR